jgi:hypothetical protein
MPDAAIITDPQSVAAPLRSEGEYLTRRQAADYIRDLLGRPMSFSTASKLAALGEFAPPVLWWGRRPLYTRDGLRAWAEGRSRRATDANGSPQPRRSRPKARPAERKTTPEEAPTP